MRLTAAELARRCGGELKGDGAREVTGAAPIEKAGPSDLAFLADPAHAAAASACKAGCLIAPAGSEEAFKNFPGALIFAKSPKYAFSLALGLFEAELRPLPAPGAHPSAVISPSARVAGGASVGPCAVIEDGASVADGAVIGAQCYIGRNAKVGAGTRLYPGVKIMDACEIGAQCILHAGVVIGGDGYGYISPGGEHKKIPQIGRVVIEDDVEIGANSAIDRAALETTRIGAGTKIDNLVHIAHNVQLGRHCLIMGQVGIAGSAVLGDHNILGGQVAVSDHVTIGDNTIVMGKTGVMFSLGPNQIVFGHTARPRLLAMKIEALLSKLPEMHKNLNKIKKHLGI